MMVNIFVEEVKSVVESIDNEYVTMWVNIHMHIFMQLLNFLLLFRAEYISSFFFNFIPELLNSFTFLFNLNFSLLNHVLFFIVLNNVLHFIWLTVVVGNVEAREDLNHII